MKKIVLGTLLVLFGNFYSYAEPPRQFFFEGTFLRAGIDGNVQSSRSGILGTTIDLDSDFGFDDTRVFAVKAGIVLRHRHEAVLNYEQYLYDQDAILATAVQFGGIEFFPHVPISSSLKLQIIGFSYGYRVINGNSGFLAVRPGIQLANYEVEVSSRLFGFQLGPTDASERLITPSLKLAGEYKLHSMITVKGELGGGWLQERKAFTLQPLLKLSPARYVSVLAGYRWVWYEYDSGGNLFDTTLSGPLFGIQVDW